MKRLQKLFVETPGFIFKTYDEALEALEVSSCSGTVTDNNQLNSQLMSFCNSAEEKKGKLKLNLNDRAIRSDNHVEVMVPRRAEKFMDI